jgi:hypothetical protein
MMSTHRERAGSCVTRPNEMANLEVKLTTGEKVKKLRLVARTLSG